MGGYEEGRTHSLKIVVQISPSVTPCGFFTIVHHGLNSVMIMSSSTRGMVAGSSFAVKGISRSRAS